MKTIHLVMSIEGLERQLNKKSELKRNKYCIQSFGLNYEQVKEGLEKYKAKGYTAIPGAGCDNILPDGRCGGH